MVYESRSLSFVLFICLFVFVFFFLTAFIIILLHVSIVYICSVTEWLGPSVCGERKGGLAYNVLTASLSLSLWITPMVFGPALGLFHYLFSRSKYAIFITLLKTPNHAVLCPHHFTKWSLLVHKTS